MTNSSAKRVAKVKLTISKRAIDAFQAADKPWIAWDDKLTGFGVMVHPSGLKSFVVNYRITKRRRKGPNRRVVIGRCDRISADQARGTALDMLGKAAMGEDPTVEPATAPPIPTLGEAFADYLTVNPNRKPRTNADYRKDFDRYLSDWSTRSLDRITRRDVEARFNDLTKTRGWSTGNKIVSLLGSIYRRPCVDHETLRNPVQLWRAGGGRFNPKPRRKVPPPAEVLPRWRVGIEAAVTDPRSRDALYFAVYTGMRLGEVLALRWERIDTDTLVFRVDETKTGAPLELPITRQLAAIIERRREYGGAPAEGWLFPSYGRTGHLVCLENRYAPISKAGGAKFWFHALRNCFITVAERDLMLPHTLTKRLVNHAPPSDVTEGYASDWTIEQLREPAQRIADRIDALMHDRESVTAAA